ncbi:MAG: dolichol-phosphate [Planctomycetota bacterium]|nr:MAG: dolichol-phosphate [Planctomycetota bacterium]
MQLSVLVPTFCEAENLPVLVPAVRAALAGVEAELLVLDDASPDGTADVADRTAPGFCRAIRRTGPRGLSHAVIEGFRLARGECVAIMDADLQHPPEVLPRLLEVVASGRGDLAVASRYVPGGGTEGWSWMRRWMSRYACRLARRVTAVKDATSGCFLCRRSVVEGVEFDPRGFKIGLEVMVKGRWSKMEEVPYVFRPRRAGASKASLGPAFAYLAQLRALKRHKRA